MSNFKFYTEEEIQELQRELSTGENLSSIARRISFKNKRSLQGVYCKLVYLSKNKKESQAPLAATKEVKQAKLGITLPEGMSFEGVPKKVILYSDHFRIYF